MDQLCPRCNGHQVTKDDNHTVARSAGLVGVMIARAATSYKCPICGKIPLAEFPEEFQSSVKHKRVFTVLGAVGILIAVFVLLIFVQSM